MSRFTYKVAEQELQTFDETAYQLVDKEDKDSPLNNFVAFEDLMLENVKYLNRNFSNTGFNISDMDYLMIEDKLGEIYPKFDLRINTINNLIVIILDYHNGCVRDELSECLEIDPNSISVVYKDSKTFIIINVDRCDV